ncbi:MAG: FHIPEP family type III secretion protein [Pseudoruegeria sp.]
MRKDLILVSLLVAILALMIVPISQRIIDILLSLNLSLAVVLLMMAVYLKHSSDFSTFPSVILISTAFRLALSIGTTRMILSEADGGQIIGVFGDFVVGGNVAIGLVIFLIVTVVQFLVVTKGAERVAEVGARFALDALPGKQMSIDADVRAGIVNAEEGEKMRRRLDKDSQFFGAMDGAMKFVKGDAIAGLIIIAINLIGGIAVGVVSHGMTFGGAVSIYSLLTIGDGLVAQIPALLMSMCAGVIVTRVASPDNVDLGTDIAGELLADFRVTSIAAIIVGMIGFIPGFPMFTFFACSATLAVLSYSVKKRILVLDMKEQEEIAAAPGDVTRTKEEVFPGEEPIELSRRIRVLLGTDLSKRVDMDAIRVTSRKNFERLSETYGINFPHVKIIADPKVHTDSIVIECDEVPIGSEIIPANHLMVDCEMSILERAGCSEEQLKKITWPTFLGYWVPHAFKSALLDMEVESENLESRISERIFRVYEANIGILFSRAEFDAIMTDAEASDPETLSGILTELPRSGLFQVIQYLIEDGVPIRPTTLFFESLLYWIQTSDVTSPVLLAECMRSSMKRQLCHAISSETGLLGLAMVDPALEAAIRGRVAEAKRTGIASAADGLVLPADILEPLLEQLHKLTQNERKSTQTLVVVTSADLRRRMRSLFAANGIDVAVMSPHEISSDINALPISLIRLPTNVAPKRTPRRSRNKVPAGE